MTLDEAIKHCEEVAEEKENEGKLLCQSESASIGCLACAEEHRQLAEWLKDYKRLKKHEPCCKCIEFKRYAKEMGFEIKQEPCEDAISRTSLLKKFEDRFIELQKAHQKEKQLGINWCINTLKDMPPVTPTQNWIPVSERLPENETRVLTTIKIPNRIARVRSGWYDSGFFHNDNGDVWKATDMEVLAWMPLPEPMKVGEEE